VTSLYHSKQKSLQGGNSLNHTPVREKKDENVNTVEKVVGANSKRSLPTSGLYQSNDVTVNSASKLENSQNKIRFEKRTPQRLDK
jgi:hypothetical protein